MEPDWLSLQNYDRCSSWDYMDWCHAIEVRWTSYRFFKDPSASKVFLDWLKLEGKSLHSSEAPAYWTRVLVSIHRNSPEMKASSGRALSPIYEVSLEVLGILFHEITASFSQAEMDALHGGGDDNATELWKQNVEEFYLARGDEPNYFNNATLATIELDAPDDLLVEEFLRFIKQRRKQLGIKNLKKIPSKAELGRWYVNRVLCYFDLNWWAEINGINLTNEQIGTLLFPNEYDVSLADRVRKVVKPMAKEVFTSTTIRSLKEHG
jgi:hypothetical protein